MSSQSESEPNPYLIDVESVPAATPGVTDEEERYVDPTGENEQLGDEHPEIKYRKLEKGSYIGLPITENRPPLSGPTMTLDAIKLTGTDVVTELNIPDGRYQSDGSVWVARSASGKFSLINGDTAVQHEADRKVVGDEFAVHQSTNGTRIDLPADSPVYVGREVDGSISLIPQSEHADTAETAKIFATVVVENSGEYPQVNFNALENGRDGAQAVVLYGKRTSKVEVNQ